MKRIKVLQFPIANSRGGVTQYAMKNWEFINKERFQFDFATLSKKLDFEEELTQYRCKVHYLSCSVEEDEEKFTKEFKQVLQEGYDIVHLHTTLWKSFLAEKLALEFGVKKVIVHSHSTMVEILNDRDREKALEVHKKQKELFSSDFATDFWACSQLAADWLFGNQIPKKQISIAKNAINVEEFSFNKEKRTEYREKLGLEKCFVIGHVGRFAYSKNHEMIIDIFREVCTIKSNVRLMLIGTGSTQQRILDKVKYYGISDKVIFMGQRNDVNYLLQAIDLFILPSRFEGLPISLIEAQASGVKCLSSSNVTNEVAVTENIEFIPLEIDKWVERIIFYSNGYVRNNVDQFIIDKGYDIKKQIKNIEQLYDF
ncbi:glycosyltransferase [Paenibacillus sp. CAU 1782]